jgi:putative oxidoreductase
MERVLGRVGPQLYAILRIVSGLLFACHGAAKLFGVLGGPRVALQSQFGLAGIIELVCGVLIAIGFFAGYAAFLASGEMAAAYFIAHYPRGPWPMRNGGEPVVLFCFLFLFIASRGAGIWGVDRSRK